MKNPNTAYKNLTFSVFFIPTKKRKILIVNGYKFYINTSNDYGRTWWRCSISTINKCTATAITKDNVLVVHKGSHNHEPNLYHGRLSKAKNLSSSDVVQLDNKTSYYTNQYYWFGFLWSVVWMLYRCVDCYFVLKWSAIDNLKKHRLWCFFYYC